MEFMDICPLEKDGVHLVLILGGQGEMLSRDVEGFGADILHS